MPENLPVEDITTESAQGQIWPQEAPSQNLTTVVSFLNSINYRSAPFGSQASFLQTVP
jgi:hypothetical protein